MRKKIASIILAVLMLVSVFTHADLSISKAEESIPYTTADEDLSKADNFDISDYPEDLSDYSVDVVQVALSEDFTDLYIYVYVPSFRLSKRTATSINISLTDDVDTLDFSNYKLIACDTDGVLHKYLVDGISLPLVNPLYINIPSIFSDPYIPGQILPDDSIGGTTVEESFKVAKCYKVDNTVNGVFYSCVNTNVVTITAQTAGFLRYWNGYIFWTGEDPYVDSHFVAFSTDWTIDCLYEIELEYYSQQIICTLPGTDDEQKIEGEKTYNSIVIYPGEVNTRPGIFGVKHTWNRIQTVKKFIESEDLTDETLSSLSDKEWVLRFCETSFTAGETEDSYYTESYTEISEITILRLKFATDGIVYNLGVVSDKVTEDNKQDNNKDKGIFSGDSWWDSILNWLNVDYLLDKFLSAILGIALIVFVFNLLSAIIKAIKKNKRKKKK